MYRHGAKLNKDILRLPTKKRGSVLDIGCGWGGNSIYLFKQGMKVLCIDTDRSAIEFIKKQGLNAQCVSADNFKFKKKYDLILMMNILHLIKNPNGLIKNAMTHLKKSGILYAQTFSLNYKFSFASASIKHAVVKDNHPPCGTHTHQIYKIIIYKT